MLPHQDNTSPHQTPIRSCSLYTGFTVCFHTKTTHLHIKTHQKVFVIHRFLLYASTAKQHISTSNAHQKLFVIHMQVLLYASTPRQHISTPDTRQKLSVVHMFRICPLYAGIVSSSVLDLTTTITTSLPAFHFVADAGHLACRLGTPHTAGQSNVRFTRCRGVKYWAK